MGKISSTYFRNAALVVVASAVILSDNSCATCAFQRVPFVIRRRDRSSCLFSSSGGGMNPLPPSDDENGNDNGWGEFLNPKEESENLRRARDFMSEQSLPLSYDETYDENDEDDEDDDDTLDMSSSDKRLEAFENSSALVAPAAFGRLDGPSQEALAKNPYMQVVSKLSPSELISKFTATANPRVQDAVRNTILGLIGSLPKMAFDTTTITTGQRLASLMFQLQMTGYMFKNADYRLSLSQSLGMSESSPYRLTGSGDEDEEKLPVDGKIRGKLKLKYGGSTAANKESSQNSTATVEMEVDAAAYMSELRTEVKQLRDELMRTQQSKEDAIRKDLLLYIRTLPEKELRSLTGTMSQEVLVSMKGLVNAVMSGIGDGQITADTITEQSGEAMAQLCMWQLVVGYNLRELEVREEMKRSLLNGSSPDHDGGVDLSAPGVLE